MAPVRANRLSVRTLIVGTVIVLLSACSTEFDRKLGEAEALRAEAARAGAEWLKTGDLLDEARAAAADGDTETALMLVEEARFQAEAALQQAAYEAGAWQDRVIK